MQTPKKETVAVDQEFLLRLSKEVQDLKKSVKQLDNYVHEEPDLEGQKQLAIEVEFHSDTSPSERSEYTAKFHTAFRKFLAQWEVCQLHAKYED